MSTKPWRSVRALGLAGLLLQPGLAWAQAEVKGEVKAADRTTPAFGMVWSGTTYVPTATYSQLVGRSGSQQLTVSGRPTFPGPFSGRLPVGEWGTVSWSAAAYTPISVYTGGGYVTLPVRFYFETREHDSSGCSDTACSEFVIRLFSRYGSASGQVALEDGTAVPNVAVSATPAEGTYPASYTWTDENGHFDFTRESGIFPDQKLGFSGGDATFSRENNWGLPVLGDGGGDPELRAAVSHTQGKLLYYFTAGKQEGSAMIDGARMATVDFTVAPPDKDEDDPSKQGDGEDGTEDESEQGQDEKEPGENPCADVGLPVNAPTGNVHLSQTDVVISGLRGPVPFERTYNSQNGDRYVDSGFGYGWTHSFATSVTQKFGGLVVLRKANGVPVYFTDPGGTSTFRPLAGVTTRSWIVKSGSSFVRTFRLGGSERYDAAGRLTERTDRVGNTTRLEYDQNGRPTRITIPGGRALTLQYEGGRVRSLLGPDGVEVAHYDYQGELLRQVTYSDGSGYQFTYDDRRQLTTAWDLSGRVLERHEYQGNRAVTSEKDDGRERLTFAYGPGRTTVTDALGRETVYDWTEVRALKRITAISGACGSCSGGNVRREWTHDGAGRVTSYRNGVGALTSYAYNADGDRTSRTDALSRPVMRTFNSRGQVLTSTRPGNRTTVFGYVDAGRSSVTTPAGRTTSYAYDANGQLVAVTDPNGHTTTLERNDFGDVTAIVDPLGNRNEFTYDAYGRSISIKDPVGNVTTTTYNGAGLMTRIASPEGTHTDFEYDKGGRRVTATDALARTTHFNFDKYGYLESVMDPLRQATRYVYDPMGRLSSITDARGNRTRSVRDGMGRIESIVYPDGVTESFTYDTTGHQLTRRDRNGTTTAHVYDALGRVTTTTYSGDTTPVVYTYDEAGRVRTAANGSDTLTWTYDPDGRLLTERSSRNGSIVAYGYDAAGYRTSVSLDGQLLTTYERAAAGRLDVLRRGPLTFAFEYDDASRRTRLQFPNDVVTTYLYDRRSRVEQLEARRGVEEILRYAYSFDALGNSLRKEGPGYVDSNNYDALSRLTELDRQGSDPGAWLYRYDPTGNRTSWQQDDSVTSAQHNNRNQLLSTEAGGPLRVRGRLDEPGTVSIGGVPAQALPGNGFEGTVGVTSGLNQIAVQARDTSGNIRTSTYQVNVGGQAATYAYDANGNLVSRTLADGTWSYEWNARCQLTRVTRDGTEVARFRYDPLGRRIEKVTGGRIQGFLYDGVDILRETRSDGIVYVYVHGPGIDEPLARIGQGSETSYYHADAAGSIVKMTDAVGAIVLTRDYDAWGAPRLGGGEAGYAFTGREWDQETGLYYYRARYYEPRAGRFLSQDPIGFSGGTNFYAYAGNNPLRFTDPFGLSPYVVVNLSAGGSAGPLAGEFGTTYAINPATGNTSVYTYAGLGVGIGVGAAAGAEVGAMDMDSPTDITGFGLAAGGFVAAGPEGAIASLFGTAFMGNGAGGAAVGVAAGFGLGISGLLTHTQLITVIDFSKLPAAVIEALKKAYDSLPKELQDRLRQDLCR